MRKFDEEEEESVIQDLRSLFGHNDDDVEDDESAVRDLDNASNTILSIISSIVYFAFYFILVGWLIIIIIIIIIYLELFFLFLFSSPFKIHREGQKYLYFSSAVSL